MEPRVLVVYHTVDGQAATIANRIADDLSRDFVVDASLAS